jgi:type IV pilus assembly protein PilW
VAVSDTTGIATIAHTVVPSRSTTLPVTYQAVNGALLNLGPAAAVGRVVYSVDPATSTLRSQNLLPTAGEVVPIVADVVNLKAQFGLDTDADGAIDVWQEASGDWSLANQQAARWNVLSRIRAVRVAIVTRSSQFERDPVTTDPLLMFDDTVSMNLDADQQHYRYKVLETIVPLRNQVWNDK